MTDDRWTRIDQPVLQALVEHFEQHRGPIRASAVATTTGLDIINVRRSINLLAQDGLVVVPKNAPRVSDLAGEHALGVTPAGLRRAGEWPTTELAFGRLIEALEAIAENTDDSDTRTNARKFADWLRASVNTVGVSVAGAVITGQMPS